MATYELRFIDRDNFTVAYEGELSWRNEGKANESNSIKPGKKYNLVTIKSPGSTEEESTQILGTYWKIDPNKGKSFFYNITVSGGESGGDVEYIYMSLVLSFPKVSLVDETVEDIRWGIAGQALLNFRDSENREYLVVGKNTAA